MGLHVKNKRIKGVLAGALTVFGVGSAVFYMATGQQALANTGFVFSEGSAYNILKKDSTIKATVGDGVEVHKAEINIYATQEIAPNSLAKISCKPSGASVECVVNRNDLGNKLDTEGTYWLYISGEANDRHKTTIEGAWLRVVVDNTAPVVGVKVAESVNVPAIGTKFNVVVDYGASGYGLLVAELRDSAGSTIQGVKLDCNSDGVCQIVEGIDLLAPGGTYRLWVSAADAAGNKSDFIPGPTVNTAPAKPVITTVTSDGKNVMNGYTKFNGVVTSWAKAEGATKYQYGYWNDIDGNRWKPSNVYFTPPSASMSQSGTFTEGQGKHYVAVRSISSAGVVSDWASVWVVYDATAPAVSSVQLYKDHVMSTTVPAGGFTNGKAFAFNLSASEDTSRYQLRYWNDITPSSFKEAKPWTPSDLAKAGKMNTLGVYKDQFTQGDGVHYFSFSACDAAGNCSEFTKPFIITYDSTRPNAELKIEGTSYETNDTVTVTGRANDEPSLKSHWFEVKAPNGKIYYHRVASYPVPPEVSFALDTSYGPGSYTIRYVVEDKAGNRSDDPKYANTIVKTVEIKDTEVPKTNDPEYVADTNPGGEASGDGGREDAEPDLNDQTSGSNTDETISQGQRSTSGVGAQTDGSSLARSLAQSRALVSTGEVFGVTTEDSDTNEESVPVVAMNNGNSGPGPRGSVLAAEDERASGPWSLIGSLWYVWLVLVAGLAWWIIAAVRRRREDGQYFAS